MSEKKIQPKKVEAVAALKESFGRVNDFFFTDYRGLTVEQITELRTKLRGLNAEYKVVKNNFAKIAFREMEGEDVDEYLVGPTAVALALDESGPVAKALLEFAEENPIAVKGGLIAGGSYDHKQVEAYSKLPTRIELIQKLMGTMNAPAQNMVYVLNGVTTKLVRTLQAVADQKAAN
ncbi:50S ribosomal protein L10 [Spirochaeta cellobiosiphila]|uniref:50S ribosomal protein L10 n=1 Tax=Spirochaeta cellobiosiphila TaxID=504483 RepID=UPI0003FB630D|nr:50S ribosomal protein L10 [Spirochaeta cellobiosiphila]